MTRIKPELIKNKKRKEEDSDSEPDSDVESEPETSSSEEEVSKGKRTKMQKKKQNKKTNKIKKNKKHDDGSDDGDDDGYDQTEYNKFLEKMFPSKYLKKKISDLENKKASKKVKPSNKSEKQKKKSSKFTIEELDDDDDDDDEYFEKLNGVSEKTLEKYHPESVFHNYDEIDTLSRVVRDGNNKIIDPFHKTLPIMTKYEKARILGQRAKQIDDNATVFVKTEDNIIDSYKIAEMELTAKKIPFIIKKTFTWWFL